MGAVKEAFLYDVDPSKKELDKANECVIISNTEEN